MSNHKYNICRQRVPRRLLLCLGQRAHWIGLSTGHIPQRDERETRVGVFRLYKWLLLRQLWQPQPHGPVCGGLLLPPWQ